MIIPTSMKALNLDVYFRKHTAAIHIKSDLTAIDYKILNILYKCAFDTDNFSSGKYFIKISDIKKILGWKKSKLTHIKNSLKKIRESGINWNIFQQDVKNKNDWIAAGGVGFISEYQVRKDYGFINFIISETILRLLKSPNIYTYIDLRLQKKFKGKYEITYYEYFLEQVFRNNKSEIITPWYSISDIRRMLNVSEKKYKVQKAFYRRCVKEPILNINNANVKLKVEIHSIERVERRIVAFQFKVIFDGNLNPFQNSNQKIEEVNILDQYTYDIEKELSLFFSPTATNQIIDETKMKYPEYYQRYIHANIEYVKQKQQTGTVDKLGGYIRFAINEDYAGFVEKLEIKEKKQQMKIEKRKQMAVEKKQQAKEQDQIQAEFNENEKIFNSMSSIERKKIENYLNETNKVFRLLPKLAQKTMIIGEYKKK